MSKINVKIGNFIAIIITTSIFWFNTDRKPLNFSYRFLLYEQKFAIK